MPPNRFFCQLKVTGNVKNSIQPHGRFGLRHIISQGSIAGLGDTVARLRFRSEAQQIEIQVQPGGLIYVRRCDTGTLRASRLGRDSEEFEVLAPLRTLSEKQAEIRITSEDAIEIADCGSANGTLAELRPGQPYHVEQYRSVWLGPDLVIEVDESPWRLPSPAALAGDPARLAALILARLGKYVEEVWVEASGIVRRPSADLSSIQLLATGKHLIIRWRLRTVCEEARRFLRGLVSLYNIESTAAAPVSPGWKFTAASTERAQVLELARRVAQSQLSVLIRGQSGVGKGVLAQDIHDHSPRRDGPFVVINSAAIPDHLLESELFGVQPGAFTGATRARQGFMQRADGGTIFLDEVGDLPLALQPKILRVLESGRVQPLGSDSEKCVDVRVIAATLRNLEEMVVRGEFREDLYHRLCGVQIAIPPLSTSDKRALAKIALEEEEELRAIRLMAAERDAVLNWATAGNWRGGARELQFALSRYLLLREPGRSPADTWKQAVATGSLLPQAQQNIPTATGRTGDLVGESRVVAQTFNNVLFLAAVRELLAENKSARLSDIADRVQMTYGGAKAKLKGLGVKLGTAEDAILIDRQLAKELEELAPFRASLQSLLGLDRA